MDFTDFKLQHSLNNDSENAEEAMFDSCRDGDFEMCKLITRNFPDINIHEPVNSFIQDHIFRVTCKNNHLEIAQWLKVTWPAIDHTLNDDAALRNCFIYHRSKKRQLHMKPLTKWLIRLYDINLIRRPIDILFEKNQLYYVKYVIKYFGIHELQIDDKYQSLFNDMIDEYQNRERHVKSARNY